MKKLTILFLLLISVLLFSCDPNDKLPPPGNNSSITEVTFTGNSRTINFNGLKNNNIVLLKVNTSFAEIDAYNTGFAYLPSQAVEYQSRMLSISSILSEIPIKGHPTATRFHAKPPSLPDNIITRRAPTVLSTSNTVGDKYDFWVESEFNNKIFEQREAVLQAIGEHCKIWVMPNNDDDKTIIQAKVRTLAQKFDIIYPAATNLLGHEYGAAPDENNGIDGDPKIQILVYDIGEGTCGYFWGKDSYNDPYVDPIYGTLRSNEAEMFYLNAKYVNSNPDLIYSTMIHEFQHMVNWNVKTLKNKKESAAWYNEMLSMMAEDVMSSLIGISSTNSDHITQEFTPLFLAIYDLIGLTEWLDGDDSLISYAFYYGYGAYLLRNYGGAALLKELLFNDLVNETSITDALYKLYGTKYDFQYTLRRFGEALVYASSLPEGAMSFDKTVSNTINGTTYTAYGFNVWKFKNLEMISDYNLLSYFKGNGPWIWSIEYSISMPPYSIALFSHPDWLNRTGNFSITLYRPDSNIKFFLMIF